MAKDSRQGGGFWAFVFGGLIGLVSGLLLAPRSGKETREQLMSKAEELMEQGKESYFTQKGRLQEVASEKGEMLRGRIDEAKERIKIGVDTAASAAKGSIERITIKQEEAAREERMREEEAAKEAEAQKRAQAQE